ncbi:MAG: arabinose isomerase [Spirochaetes bacterium RBG_16_67_19]|nr:MAG: arabinose isomerase [Spirochaetes bacterium RBG_16_67_19]
MISTRKPRIGLLGLMHGLYDKSQPDLPAEQEGFARALADRLKDEAVVDFPGAAKDRGLIEKYVKYFNEKEYDGIMVVNLLYSPGMRVVQALQKNTLPLLLANVQPLPGVTKEWNWRLLTTNQGIHGIQDTANMIARAGLHPTIVTEDWESGAFKFIFADWAMAASAFQRLKGMKVAIFGRMPDMGDILGDDAAFYRKLGLEVNHETIGAVYRLMEGLSPKEIDMQVAEDRRNFAVDAQLSAESHRYAAALQLAFEKFMQERGYSGFTAFFNIFKEDGRFKQLPILGASNLLAKGFGYAAEGDTNVLALTVIGHLLVGNPHFTEMYSLDFGRDAALLSHMGEGNWKVARKDRPIRLIDRPLDIGERDNPPTPVYSAQPGRATLLSLVAVQGEMYRLVVSQGTILDSEEIPGIPMNYSFFKPDSGIRKSMNTWLECGGTHHQVLFLGDQARRFKVLCDIARIEYVEA